MTVDRSESMESLSDVAIQSFNELIEQQKQIAAESRFTLTLFNDRIATIHDAIPIAEVPATPRQRRRPTAEHRSTMASRTRSAPSPRALRVMAIRFFASS